MIYRRTANHNLLFPVYYYPMSRAFATRTAPRFGTAKRPAHPSSWQRSVYYWWWEYLRRNDAYKICCEKGGQGELAKLYADFGDVHAMDFKQWWTENNRGGILFTEQVAEDILRELNPEQAASLGTWNRRDFMVVLVPLSQPKRHLTKRFTTLLKHRHEGARGKRMLAKTTAMYKLAGQFTIESLRATLKAYDLRQENPKMPLWRVALEAGLAKTVQKERASSIYEPDADQKNALNVAASRALKRAKAMIANTAKGVFPKSVT